MKKLFSTILAATILFAFGCSPQKEKGSVTVSDFANATPENAKIFVAYNIDKEFVKAYNEQKGIKELLNEFTKNDALQKILNDIYFNKINEATKGIITADTFNNFLTEYSKASDAFFLGANSDRLSEDFNGNLLVYSPLIVKFAKDSLDKVSEKELIKKSEKDGISTYKSDKFAIVIKGDLIVASNTEADANKLIDSLKTPIEKSFAKTQNFAKLNAINNGANALLFADINEKTDAHTAGIFASLKNTSITEVIATVKIELGEKGIKESAEALKNFAQRTLQKGSFLKNSIKDSTFALGIAIPKTSKELTEAINKLTGGNDPSVAMIMQMISAIDIKNLYLSCGELDAQKILKIQETMQPPELFLKIGCENTDAFFQNPMMAQLLNSPFISPMKVGETTIYTTMANVKFAQMSKDCAFISTIPDLAKTTNLVKGTGENLSKNQDATYLINKLPEGGFIEAFIDLKKLNDFSTQMQENIFKEIPQENLDKEMKSAMKLLDAFKGTIKKSALATSVKLDGASIIINLVGNGEYDYEKMLKQVAELK